MQLKGPSVFLVGAAHTLLHEAGGTHSMHNANAYPAYQYPNPDQLKKLTAPLIAFFHALELDLSNRSLQKRQSLSFALTWI
jgi:hypothetical protein